ncbi:hypothetical protein FQR65_LT06980 [Abscondita terminalis]|nr:hypothetical protein FQR65_LT06980 [Abscondita terminalis]
MSVNRISTTVLICGAITLILADAKQSFSNYTKNDRPEVKLNNGLVVVGTVNKTSGSNKIYRAFRGIPFAQPPLGDLRFKPPVPLPGSLAEYTVDASQDKSSCVQLGVPVTGTEDCLYINVYTPVTCNSSEVLPVMVWIYGGGFIYGNSSYSIYGPDFLLDQGVVFVSFNYRLGLFGFLSTEDEVSPGNYGLKDQILALHWVKDNIGSFGGNSSRITIFSESAGAASASYLSLTPLTKGLFQNAIFESGNSIVPWALTRNPREAAFAAGALLKINSTSSQALVDALRQIDFKSLANAQTALYIESVATGNPLNGLPIGPTVEPNNPGAVVTNHSYELLRNGLFHRIPYLMGINSQESLPFEEDLAKVREYLTKYDLLPDALVPASLNIENPIEKRLVNAIIKSHYFGITPITISNQRLIEFLSDDLFNRPIIEAGLLYSSFSKVFFYEFSHKGPLGSGNITNTGNVVFIKVNV